MKTLKLKIICNVPGSAVHACLQHPLAKLGEVGTVRTIEITDIPEAVDNTRVLLAWKHTTDASYLGNDGKYPRHSYRFEEIGEGKIIMGKA